MTGFLARRLLQSLLLLVIVLTITFTLLQLAPGDPLSRYYDPEMSPETLDLIRRNLGLDRSVPEQYLRWMGSFLRGDFASNDGANLPLEEFAHTFNSVGRHGRGER